MFHRHFKVNLSVLVSQDCCKTASQTGWLETIEFYFLMTLNARGLKSSCQQVMLPLKVRRKIPPFLCSFQVLLGLWQHDSSLCPHLLLAFPVFLLCLFLFLWTHQSLDWGPTLSAFIYLFCLRCIISFMITEIMPFHCNLWYLVQCQ